MTKRKFSAAKIAIFVSCLLGICALAVFLIYVYCSTPPSLDGIAYSINGINVEEEYVTQIIQEYRAEQGLLDDEAWEQAKAESETDTLAIRYEVISDLTDIYTTKVIEQTYGIEVSDTEVDYHLQKKGAVYQLAMRDAKELRWSLQKSVSERDMVRSELVHAKIGMQYVLDYECSDEEIDNYILSCGDSLHNADSYSLIVVSQEAIDDLNLSLQTIKDGIVNFETAALNNFVSNWQYSYAFPQVVYYNNTYVLPKSVVMSLPTNLALGQMSDVISNNGFYFIAKYEGKVDAPEVVNSKDDLSDKVLDQIKNQIKGRNYNEIIGECERVAKEKMDFVLYNPSVDLPY